MKTASSHKVIASAILLVFVLSFTLAGYTQEKNVIHRLQIPDSSTVQMITTMDGSTLIGRTIDIMDDMILFETEMGNISLKISRIKKIDEVPVNSIRGGSYWFPNPNYTRLYFAPTGRMLKKGKGYFSDYYIFFPGIAYGLTDRLTIGGGFSIFPGVSMNDQLFFFTPKIGLVQSDDINLAAGALIIKIPDEDDFGTFGILYGVGTYGSADRSFSVGLGYGFASGDVANEPVLMIGVENRFARRVAFVSENWIFPGVDNPLISYGLRFFGESMSFDLGFFNVLGKDALFPGIPWVDFVYNF
ncbi:MAG: hypothetical protein AB7T22_11680 [Calditrichaceae bacterium]